MPTQNMRDLMEQHEQQSEAKSVGYFQGPGSVAERYVRNPPRQGWRVLALGADQMPVVLMQLRKAPKLSCRGARIPVEAAGDVIAVLAGDNDDARLFGIAA